jgi:hypothetical protein
MVKKILLIVLIIAVIGLVYMVIPKYQIQTVRVDENYVLITKINTLTGEVDTDWENNIPRKGIPKFGIP